MKERKSASTKIDYSEIFETKFFAKITSGKYKLLAKVSSENVKVDSLEGI